MESNMKKYFQVDVMTVVEIPFEEGLMNDGQINKNHLMYVAQSILEKNPDRLLSL
jgi:hypothetical protein